MSPRANKITEPSSEKPAERDSAKTSLQTDETVYFWREVDPDFGFLSQWYYCPFTDSKDPSIVYPTAEHYMMYHKALLFEDTKTAAKILADPSPRTARSLGRKVTPFSEETWAANRERIVTEASLAKFSRPVSEDSFRRGNGDEAAEFPESEGGRLKAALLATGDREIVEASPRDRIWGVGFGAKDAGSQRERWGLNLLGKALMEARRILREEERAGGVGVSEAG